jgi:spermidine synthase
MADMDKKEENVGSAQAEESPARVLAEGAQKGISPGFLYFLMLTALISGSQVMVVEVMGAKVIGPFFGASLFVWTSLITVTLVALSIGYAFGGALSDKRGSADYLYGLILFSGVLVLVIPMAKGVVIQAAQPLGLRAGSLVSASVLFGPSLLLLGCVSPYVIKLAARELKNIGRTVGFLYAISTAGSVVGTIMAGFVLLAYFSVSRIFLFTGLALIALAVSYFVIFRRKWASAALLVIPLFFTADEPFRSKTLPSGTVVSVVYERDGFYGKLKVVDYAYSGDVSREMIIDGAIQSKVDLSTGLPINMYYYLVSYIPMHINPGGRSCLAIGLGSGVVPMLFEMQGVTTDVVEIDPLVVEAAEKYFNYSSSGEVFVEDARYHLINSEKAYDYMVLDVFNSDITPSHVISKEAFDLMRARLDKRGVFAMNLAGSLKEDSFITASIVRTLEEVFETVEIYLSSPLKEAESFSNLIVVAYDFPPARIDKTALRNRYVHYLEREMFTKVAGLKYRFPPDVEAMVLTDDYNPVEFFSIDLHEFMRNTIIGGTEPEVLL